MCRKSSSGDQQSDTIMLFVSLVPHTEIECGSREEARFCHAEKEAYDEEPGKILSEAHKSANDTPREGESRKPELRSGEFEDDVTWDFKKDITDEADG